MHSVNPLYLIIHSATGYFKEKNGEKYLIIHSTEKYDEVFPWIKSEIETLNGGKELLYEKNYARIGVNTDNDLPLNKPPKFPMLTIIIRGVFQKGAKLYHNHKKKKTRLKSTKEKGIKNWFSIKKKR